MICLNKVTVTKVIYYIVFFIHFMAIYIIMLELTLIQIEHLSKHQEQIPHSFIVSFRCIFINLFIR